MPCVVSPLQHEGKPTAIKVTAPEGKPLTRIKQGRVGEKESTKPGTNKSAKRTPDVAPALDSELEFPSLG